MAASGRERRARAGGAFGRDVARIGRASGAPHATARDQFVGSGRLRVVAAPTRRAARARGLWRERAVRPAILIQSPAISLYVEIVGYISRAPSTVQ